MKIEATVNLNLTTEEKATLWKAYDLIFQVYYDDFSEEVLTRKIEKMGIRDFDFAEFGGCFRCLLKAMDEELAEKIDADNSRFI